MGRDKRDQVYEVLKELSIPYVVHEHEAIFSADDAEKLNVDLPGINVKNLIIWDKKTDEHYMVVLEDKSRLDFKAFRKLTGWSGKATFAGPEVLKKYLDIEPGSVSPMGLINDTERHMIVVLERVISQAADDEYINVHPNDNTATISIKKKDLYKFLRWRGNKLIEEV